MDRGNQLPPFPTKTSNDLLLPNRAGHTLIKILLIPAEPSEFHGHLNKPQIVKCKLVLLGCIHRENN